MAARLTLQLMQSGPLRQVALLGGSFDPPHRAHQALARAALEQLPIDELWWVPTGQPWQKARTLTEANHRVAMLELMRAGDPRQRIETCEIERSGPTYTIDTLDALAQRHPGVQWTLVIGVDQWRGLPTWHRWQDVAARAHFAVALRPGLEAPARGPEGERATWLSMPEQAISSTAIRHGLMAGHAVGDQLTPEVAGYIAEHGLYRPTG